MKSGSLYCKAVAFRELPDFLRKNNADPEALFRLCDFFNLVVKTLDDPSLGIKYAYDVPKDFLAAGPMLILAALVPTIRDFFDLSSEYQKLHLNGLSYHYTRAVKLLNMF